MRVIKFLCLNLNNGYSYGMGNANIVDQLRGSYRFDKWMRNYKWWHTIFWWGFQVLLTNSYKVYCCYYEIHALKPMNHYEFNKYVGDVWMYPDYYK